MDVWTGIDGSDGNIRIFVGDEPHRFNLFGGWFVGCRGWKTDSCSIERISRRCKTGIVLAGVLRDAIGLYKKMEIKKATIRRCYEREKPMLYLFRNRRSQISLDKPYVNDNDFLEADFEICKEMCQENYSKYAPKGFRLAPWSHEYIELVIEPVEGK